MLLTLVREENLFGESTHRKTLEAQERSTMGTELTRNTTPDLVSTMRDTTRYLLAPPGVPLEEDLEELLVLHPLLLLDLMTKFWENEYQ